MCLLFSSLLGTGCSPAAAPKSSESFIQVVVGDFHGCALTDSHRVQCWHPLNTDDDFGQADPPDLEYSFLAAGRYQTCGLTVSGDLECWGASDYGQTVNASGPFSQVATGEYETCVIGTADDVQCWGTPPDPFGDSWPRPDIGAVRLSLNTFGCLIGEAGELACWGTTVLEALTAPAGGFSSVAAGQSHACALDVDGTPTCWGALSYGDTIEPPLGARYAEVAAGNGTTCGLTSDGTIECWGGDSDYTHVLQISGYEPEGTFINVALGWDLACGVREDGGVVCWGNGAYWDFPTADNPGYADE
jgi:hypothetical protein